MDITEHKKKVHDFLARKSFMSMAINNADRPVSIIMLYAFDDDFTFYIATHKNTIKAKSIEVDNRVSFTVWEHEELMVQGSGVASEMRDAEEIGRVLEKLVSSISKSGQENFWPPVLQMRGEPYVVYSIKTTWMKYLDLSNKMIVNTSPFIQII